MKILPLLTNYFYFQEAEKEASENISNICARIRHKEFTGKSIFKRRFKKW